MLQSMVLNKVGAGVIDGVSIGNADGSDGSGAGSVGYAYASPSGSNSTIVDGQMQQV